MSLYSVKSVREETIIYLYSVTVHFLINRPLNENNNTVE